MLVHIMPRWEPNGRERLVRAALDLFTEQGYDSTTVAQIAERAGLNKSTFFRYFPDKREVLFVGQDELCDLVAQGIAGAPPASATPLQAVGAALDAAATAFTAERRAFGPQRQAIIAANPELQERDALKVAGLGAAMTQALQARGVPDPTARIATELGLLAFHLAYVRWVDPANEQPFGELAHRSLRELQAASAALR
jgi:AcrR family transcriptional regulator